MRSGNRTMTTRARLPDEESHAANPPAARAGNEVIQRERITVPERAGLEGLEARWGARWEESATYRFDESDVGADVYSIDTPPPTVSGALHIGHVFSFTQ